MIQKNTLEEKKMKKMIAFVLALVLSLSLVACGGPDKQPAIDAFNKASTSFDAVAAVINEDPSAYAEEVINTMVEMANLLKEHKAVLESSDPIAQETLDEMIAWYGDVEAWVADVKAELGME